VIPSGGVFRLKMAPSNLGTIRAHIQVPEDCDVRI
jgi:hypothetical protein